MRLKSYFADTVEAAMALAAREMGDEALLVYSREATAETRYLGAHEVVFAAGQPGGPGDGRHLPPDEPVAPARPSPALSARQPGEDQFAWASSALAGLKSEIGFLRQDAASHRRCVEDLLTATDRRAWRLLADWGSEPELLPGVALAGRLLQADMDPEHVLDVIECTRDAVRAAGPDGERTAVWRRCLEKELADRRDCDATLQRAGAASSIVLIGPPGAGKTTVAMHLTAHAASRGLEPRLIAFEPGRLTAAQTLRSFAAVLGAPFELVRRPEALAAHLCASPPASALMIVDGPGLAATASSPAVLLAALAKLPARCEIWLVLPATLRAADLHPWTDRFAALNPSRVVFTRTAEVGHWGSVWSAAEWSGLPMAFCCDGPRIPEDFQPASALSLAARLAAGPGGAREESSAPPAGGASAGGRS